jgi:hypothetical protein
VIPNSPAPTDPATNILGQRDAIYLGTELHMECRTRAAILLKEMKKKGKKEKKEKNKPCQMVEQSILNLEPIT